MAQQTASISADTYEAGRRPRSQNSPLLARFALQGILILATFVALVPAYFMVISSFKTSNAYQLDKISFPSPITFDNYNRVLTEHPFFLWMGNSALISIGSVLLSTVVAAMAA